MSQTYIPKGYTSVMTLYETQKAIEETRREFQTRLSEALHLMRVSAPLFVTRESGLNDDLNGVERAVGFDIPETGGEAQVVHSLAKWKRMALKKYDIRVGKGLYTDMNAIRRDETMDNLHSVYVDQWDWEKAIDVRDRTEEYLRQTVRKIVDAICDTKERVNAQFPALRRTISREISFITTQELEDLYPDLTPKQRENEYVKTHPTTFLMQIGGVLRSGQKHDGRAPDYDDWQLNGDILIRNDVLDCAFEVSSMGIRVSPESLDRQLSLAGCDERRELPFHKALLAGELPYSIGGGIGQSRLCMLLLEKAHIGEVQVSVWDADTLRICKENGIEIL
ncbi:MAG: aspartate--ammonia ligase [Clostridia bacterium]|nr:aspartate--ammonia ligase [Clostridia bacterium]